jgi:hypothetical protein
MSNWEEGNYEAVTKAATVYENEKQKLILAVAFDVGGTEMKNRFVLVESDGVLNTVNIAKVREWSGWDGIDPYWFIEAAKTSIKCMVKVKMEPGFRDPTTMYPVIKWVNKAGCEGSALPEEADRRAVLSKYGAKFRAIAGPQPMGAQTKPQGATPPQRPQTATPPQQPPTRPQTTAAHATLEECWRLMQQHNQKLKPEQVTEKWYGFIDATGMDQADMTPEGWDKVKASILASAGTSEAGQQEEEGEPMPF